MNRELLKWLVVPFSVLIVVLVILNQIFDENCGLFINLITSCITIIITIFYVSWVIEKKPWKPTLERILKRILFFSKSLITGIMHLYGHGLELLDFNKMNFDDPFYIEREVMRISKDVLEPKTREKLGQLSQEEWEKMFKHLQSSWEESERIFTMFESKLNPEQYNIFMDLQDAIRDSIEFYYLFKNFAGLHDDDLLRKFDKTKEDQKACYKITAEKIEKILQLARKLGETIIESNGIQRK